MERHNGVYSCCTHTKLCFVRCHSLWNSPPRMWMLWMHVGRPLCSMRCAPATKTWSRCCCSLALTLVCAVWVWANEHTNTYIHHTSISLWTHMHLLLFSHEKVTSHFSLSRAGLFKDCENMQNLIDLYLFMLRCGEQGRHRAHGCYSVGLWRSCRCAER